MTHAIDLKTASNGTLRGLIKAAGKDPDVDFNNSDDEMRAYLMANSKPSFNLALPKLSMAIFNRIAAVVAIIMAFFPSLRLWGMLLVIGLLGVDIAKSLKVAKLAGLKRKDARLIWSYIQVETYAIGFTITALFVPDASGLYVWAAIILFGDSFTE